MVTNWKILQWYVEKILCSMTQNFAYMICSIEESKNINELSIDEFQSSLLVDEQRMRVFILHVLLLHVTKHNQQSPSGPT